MVHPDAVNGTSPAGNAHIDDDRLGLYESPPPGCGVVAKHRLGAGVKQRGD
jgi:hypothetical protein